MRELLPPTKALLEAAKRADGPPLRARNRLACRLSNAVVATTLTAGAAAAETSMGGVAHSLGILSLLPTGKLGAVLAVSIGFAGGGAVLATVHSYTRGPALARPVPQSSTLVRDSSPHRAKEATLAPLPQLVGVAPDKPNEIQRSTVPTLKTVTRTQPNVAEETKLLGQVQQALSTGNGALASSLLGQYRRDYERGALDEEASAAEVFALCAMGHKERASGAAARFLRQFPESPLGPRVRQSCGAAPADGSHSDGSHSDGSHSDGSHSDGSHFDGRKSSVAVTHE